jgi:hypothetical protein
MKLFLNTVSWYKRHAIWWCVPVQDQALRLDCYCICHGPRGQCTVLQHAADTVSVAQGVGWPRWQARAFLVDSRQTPSSGRGWSHCWRTRSGISVVECLSRTCTCSPLRTVSTGESFLTCSNCSRCTAITNCAPSSRIAYCLNPVGATVLQPSKITLSQWIICVYDAVISLVLLTFKNHIWNKFFRCLYFHGDVTPSNKRHLCCFHTLSTIKSKYLQRLYRASSNGKCRNTPSVDTLRFLSLALEATCSSCHFCYRSGRPGAALSIGHSTQDIRSSQGPTKKF